MKKILSVAALLLMSSVRLMAVDLYVSATGDDNNDGLTAETPVATLGKVLELAVNGDVIHVSGMVKSVSNLEVEGNNRNLVFQGTDPMNDGFSGDLQYRIVRFKGGINAVFNNLTFTGARFTPESGNEGGSVIHSGGSITLNNCKVFDNKTTENAARNAHGGAFRIGGNLTLTDCEIYRNEGCGGGAVEMRGGNLVVNNCQFYENKANTYDGKYNGDARGGAIECCDANMSLTKSTFTNNVSYSHGGAVDAIGSGTKVVTIDGCVFTGNCSGGVEETFAAASGIFANGRALNANGGAFYTNTTYGSNALEDYVWTITNCEFTKNSSGGEGGGLGFYSKINVDMKDCMIASNVCLKGGGGGMMVQNQEGQFSMTGVEVIDNDSKTGTGTRANADSGYGNVGMIYANGGGVQFEHSQKVDVTDCLFDGNATYGNGGGVRLSGNNLTSATFTRCTFVRNMSGGRIGALSTELGNYIMTCVPGFGRDGDRKGGAVIIEGNSMKDGAVWKFDNCTFAYNSGAHSGGAILLENGKASQELQIVNCTITKNDLVRWGANNGGGILADGKQPKLVLKNTVIDNNVYYENTDAPRGFNDANWRNNPADIQNSYVGSIQEWDQASKYLEGKTVADEVSMLHATGASLDAVLSSGLCEETFTDDGIMMFPLAVGSAATKIGAAIEGSTDVLGNAWVKNYIGSLQQAVIDVTVPETGITTFYCGAEDLVVPEGMTATTYKVADEALATSKVYAEGEVLPAGTGVVLEGTPATVRFASALTAGEADAENQLRGTDVEALTEGEGQFYRLGEEGGKPGFFWVNEDGSAFTAAAHEAYLVVNSPAVNGYYLDGMSTGIAIQKAAAATAERYYTLTGIAKRAPQKGIYVANGKKIVVK